MNSALPSATRKCVRIPAVFARYVRSMPISSPSKAASANRPMITHSPHPSGIARSRLYLRPNGLGCVKRLMSGVTAFMMRIANETPSG